MDRLIKNPDFTGGVSRICHAAIMVGEESNHIGLKVGIDSMTYDPKASDSRSSHTMWLDDALVSFTTVDYVSLLRLHQLDMVGIRPLYIQDVDEPIGDPSGEEDACGDGAGDGGGVV